MAGLLSTPPSMYEYYVNPFVSKKKTQSEPEEKKQEEKQPEPEEKKREEKQPEPAPEYVTIQQWQTLRREVDVCKMLCAVVITIQLFRCFSSR